MSGGVKYSPGTNIRGAVFMCPQGAVVNGIYWFGAGRSGGGTDPSVLYSIYQAPGGFDGVANLLAYASRTFSAATDTYETDALSFTLEPGYFYVNFGKLSGSAFVNLWVHDHEESELYTDAGGLLPAGYPLACYYLTGSTTVSPPASTFTPGKNAGVVDGPGTTVETIMQIGFL
jgi:hypothetical protein